MRKKIWLLIGIVSLLMSSAACAPSRLEMDYGTSFQLSKFNQTLHPEAAKNLEPVSGFDGEAAKATMDKYRKSFEKPAPPPVYMLSFGGVASK